jgi:hypothetical protein
MNIVEKPKHPISRYDRHSTVSIEPVIPLIKEANKVARGAPRFDINGTPVKLQSLRLQTFAEKGLVCSCCGLKATHFAIERNFTLAAKDGPYHLNLYGVDAKGDEVLFTHDHILARALKGKDVLENTQTMCCYCNWAKGLIEGELARTNHG